MKKQQQQQQQMAQMEQAQQAAAVAKDLASAQAVAPQPPMQPLEGGLQSASPEQMMGQFAGY